MEKLIEPILRRTGADMNFSSRSRTMKDKNDAPKERFIGLSTPLPPPTPPPPSLSFTNYSRYPGGTITLRNDALFRITRDL